MTADGGAEGALTLATRRLEAAAAALEARLARRAPAESAVAAGGASEADLAGIAAELAAARAREHDLALAGAQASEALTRAIADVRAALGEGA